MSSPYVTSCRLLSTGGYSALSFIQLMYHFILVKIYSHYALFITTNKKSRSVLLICFCFLFLNFATSYLFIWRYRINILVVVDWNNCCWGSMSFLSATGIITATDNFKLLIIPMSKIFRFRWRIFIIIIIHIDIPIIVEPFSTQCVNKYGA